MTTKVYHRLIQRQSNLVLFCFMLLSYIAGIILAPLHSTWLWGLSLSTSNLLLFVFFVFMVDNAQWLRYWVGIAMAAIVWQFQFQMQGAAEAFYIFFVCAVIMIIYLDARVYFSYAVATMLPQTVVYYLSFYNHTATHLSIWLDGARICSELLTLVLCMGVSYTLYNKYVRQFLQIQHYEERIKTLETSLDWVMHLSEGELHHTSDQALHGIEGGARLIEMRNKLLQARNLEEKERFVNLGLAKIAEIVSDHDYDMEDLAQKVLHEILQYFDTPLGTFYLLENTEEGSRLVLQAAYACDPEAHKRTILDAREGFIGQALQEGKVLEMTDLPDNFFTITSGLGGMKPKCVLAVPLQTNEDVVGVIELATLAPLEPYKVELLEKIGENVASSILGIKFNNTTAQLLMESKELASRLQSQEEYIRQNFTDYELQIAQKEQEIKELKSKLAV